MTTRTPYGLLASVLALLAYLGCCTGAIAQGRPQIQIPEDDPIGLYEAPRWVTGRGDRPECDVTLEVYIPGAHLNISDQVRLIGPLTPDGDYIVMTKAPHPWKGGAYVAKNQLLPWNGDVETAIYFLIATVPVKADAHSSLEEHVYSMTMEGFERGCPSYAKFQSGYHTSPDVDDDDPGHAGAKR